MEYLIYIAALIICFFTLFVLCRHDFVLLRQNISLSQIFDALFVSLIASFLLGRALFMVNSLSSELLSIVRFLHVVKFPGIELYGIFLGTFLSLFIIFMKKKGLYRIYDIFTLSFFPLALVSLLLQKSVYSFFLFPVVILIISVILFIFFLTSHNKYILRDGSISVLFVIILSVISFFTDYSNKVNHTIIFNLSLLQLLSLIVIPISIGVFILNQRKKHS